MLQRDPLTTLFIFLVIVQAATLAALLLLGQFQRQPRRILPHRFAAGLGRLARRRVLSLLAVALVSLSLDALVAAIHWPWPRVQDEFSYLLAADTFAHGRLTNPPSPMWPHFETEHVLQQPTYASKYPPAQGLFLALGQVITGEPLVGAWVASAAACSALCWMLRAFVPARWALVGGLLASLHPGIVAWWGHGYWGGSVAFLGGALMLGAARRLYDRPSTGSSLVLGAGLLLLANSRPYEGLVASLPVALVLTMRFLFRQDRPTLGSTLGRVAIPLTTVLVIGAGMMGAYNRAITGSPLRLPYQLHAATYSATPTFLLEPPPPVPEYRDRKLEDFHAGWEYKTYEQERSLRGALVASADKQRIYWAFYLGPALSLSLAGLLQRRAWRLSVTPDRWVRFALGTIGFCFTATLLTVWFNPHYMAPSAPLLFLLVVAGLRRLAANRPRGPSVARAIVVTQVVSLAFSLGAVPYVYRNLEWPAHRQHLIDSLTAQGGKHLILLRHGRDCLPHEEWIYNGADPDAQQVLWARELDSSAAHDLVGHYPDRTPWLLLAYRPDAALPTLAPYALPPAWLYDAPAYLPVPGPIGPVATHVQSELSVAAPANRNELVILSGTSPASRVDIPGPAAAVAFLDRSEPAKTMVGFVTPTSAGLVHIGSDGQPATPVITPLPAPPAVVAFVDLVGDAAPDVVVSITAGPEAGLYLLENSGHSLGAPSRISALAGVSALAAVPRPAPNAPQQLIAARGAAAPALVLAIADTAGTSTLHALEVLPPIDSTSLAAADVDSDGQFEVLSLDAAMDRLSILVKDPSGSWRQSLVPVGVSPCALTINDLDGDGLPDIAIATKYGHGLTVLRNLGGLEFAAPAEITLGRRTWFEDKAASIASACSPDGQRVYLLVGTAAAPVLFRR
ncbi:MAG: VCBS repeat-containing protein [Phycisphaeraceae bacterium]|nr:VCBS repeat-containing protein [Phycisphaeraceae bacterium]